MCKGEGWKGLSNLLVGMRESDLGLSGHYWIACISRGTHSAPFCSESLWASEMAFSGASWRADRQEARSRAEPQASVLLCPGGPAGR